MFYKYYFELKHRFLFILLCWVYAILVSYLFKEVLLHFITKNSLESDVTTYFIFTNVVEVFSVYLILIFFFGHQMTILNFFYHFLIFVLPSLTKLESQVLVRFFFISNALFVTAFVIYQKFIFVASWKFFFSLKKFTTVQSLILHFEAKLLEFSILYVKLYKICFLYFQFFLVPILLLTTIQSELRIYGSFRKLFYYFCVFFSTMVTPPDVFSQIILSCSTIICCEILVYLFTFRTILISNADL